MDHISVANETARKARCIRNRGAGLREIFRFLATGVFNTILTYVVYLGVLPVFPYPVAYATSFVVGLVFTSLANIRVVFERKLSLGSVASYGTYYIGYYLLNLIGISLAIEHAEISSRLAPLFVLPVTIPLHYLASRVLLARFQAYGDISSGR